MSPAGILERHTTVLKAVTLAAGFDRYAATKRLQVRRLVEGETREFQAQPDDYLQPDDVVVVPDSIF